MSDVTHILAQIEQGDPHAAHSLLPLVYQELRKLAAAKLANEKPGQTLQATALVHEAYLRLVGPVGNALRGVPSDGGKTDPEPRPSSSFSSRGHFFAAAAEAMRRILVENARRKNRLKHGGDIQQHELADYLATADDQNDLVLAVNESLAALQDQSPPAAQLVKLRFFAGLTLPEAAAAIDVSPRTADRLWSYAKAFLHRRLQPC